MKYPKKLEKGNIIGVTAPSHGFDNEEDLLRIENSKKKIEEKGFRVIETSNVRTNEKGRSSGKEQRVKEFMELWNNPEVKVILLASGGDFLCEMLDCLDFDELRKTEPKWIQGYSDCTNLTYVFTLNLDIATIYGPTYKAFGMNDWHISLYNSIKLMQQEELTQNSYEKYQEFKGFKESDEKNPYLGYELTKNVNWKNLTGEKNVDISGRAIGGCFDVVKNLIGTKYDKVKKFIEKYKEDGIIWFLEVFEASTPSLFCNLWQMKNAGYFNNCNGIIFGRPLMIRYDYDISYEETIKDALGDLNIPIIIDTDIGHVPPQIPIVTGSFIEINSSQGKGFIKNFLK